MIYLLLIPSLNNVSGALICLIISLICLAVAAFLGNPATEPTAPFYRRLNWGWAGLFFYVLAVAIS